jgi:DNA mismatch endonuclease (patch repair protein)
VLEERNEGQADSLRYRVDARPGATMRIRADIVFSRRNLVVVIDGCLWHGCPVHGVQPKTNSSCWNPKPTRTRERDLEATVALEGLR